LEHEWGRNVMAAGLGGLGATLAAKLHGVTGAYVTNIPSPDGIRHWIVTVPADMHVPYYFDLNGILGGGDRLPYGYTVDPDSPL